ncbi:hypothetical protein A3734_18455 [Sulfitobacter sp. HI0054]|uniref:hypothetical protein n=1 Tax=Sulfitobacter sp. HI0054 TaxID=1822238 RepID=UPI0007C30C6C|nr:hypothetical protein [Sulfitobacter sp. HI0054]KZY52606.1 hypothetical protein A3734_18455 [Sulfitobacter sp. HI0054]
MTTANALPIQERLRAVTSFYRFETGDRVAASACLSEEAADRIDALEKALQRVEWEGDEHSQQIARAALGEGE